MFVEKLELMFYYCVLGNCDENWWIIILNGLRVVELIL